MADLYIYGVLVAMNLTLLKVLTNPNYFRGYDFITVFMGCFGYSLLSWFAVARIIYYEVKRSITRGPL